MRNIERGILTFDLYQGRSVPQRLRVAKSAVVNSFSKHFFARIICCPTRSSSTPSASIPASLAANKAVPLPANGSTTLPDVIPYLDNNISMRDDETRCL